VTGQVLDAYIRVSKVAGRAGESFISPSVQRERIEAWAGLHGAELVWHEPELDVSGGRMDRPVFEKIMARVRAGETGGVVVAKLDRFARTLVGALGVLEEFERQGAVLVSVADNIDLSTPMGKAFLRIRWCSPSSSGTGSASPGCIAGCAALYQGINTAEHALHANILREPR
jgi:DNA invertase Pin-like site-specific DNA recombinase